MKPNKQTVIYILLFYLYITCSLKPKEEKKEIIIPLIKTNNWKTEHAKKAKTDKPPTLSDGNGVDAEAIKEIMQGKVIVYTVRMYCADLLY
jgi:16S rRNA C967 or C1407 C5-methylase (RsmB/RsmF family)